MKVRLWWFAVALAGLYAYWGMAKRQRPGQVFGRIPGIGLAGMFDPKAGKASGGAQAASVPIATGSMPISAQGEGNALPFDGSWG